MRRNSLGFLLATLVCLWAAPQPADAGIELRIAIKKSLRSAIFTSIEPIRVSSLKSGALLNTGIIRNIKVQKHRRGVRIGKLIFPVDSIRLDSPDRVISFNGKRYRGSLVVRDNGKGSFDVINHLDLEEYIKGVVPSEVPADWPIEALKAQAVAARTYALFKRSENSGGKFDLLSDVNDQVYGGMDRENKRTNIAVDRTKGMILTYKNQIAHTYYHSTSGPKTENGNAVFKGSNLPYLKSVTCNFGRKSPYYKWQYSARPSQIQSILSRHGIRTGRIKTISLRSHTATGRVREIGISGKAGFQTVDALQFRKMIGTKIFKSTRFTVKKQGSKLVFNGTGYGHGVGMCQWGAKGMADKNFSFRRILAHYYPGAKLTSNVYFGIE